MSEIIDSMQLNTINFTTVDRKLLDISQALSQVELFFAGVPVSSVRIKDASITNAKIANLSVVNANFANLAITNAKITSVDATDITVGTLSADRIASSSITADNRTHQPMNQWASVICRIDDLIRNRYCPHY